MKSTCLLDRIDGSIEAWYIRGDCKQDALRPHGVRVGRAALLCPGAREEGRARAVRQRGAPVHPPPALVRVVVLVGDNDADADVLGG